MFSLDNIINQATTFSLPTGPVWEVDGKEVHPDLNHTMWIRKLASAPNMLLCGALLKHTNGVEGKHFNTACFWTFVENELWIASEAAPGKNLYLEDIERLSWAEAIDAWRPLAEAVLRAHKRGIVIGNLSPMSLWYDAHLTRLVAMDPGCWIGDAYNEACRPSLPPEFIADEIKAPTKRKPTIATDVWSLANILVNLVTKSEASSFDGIPAYAIDGLKNALRLDSRTQSVSELLAVTTPPKLRASMEKETTSTDVFFGRIGNFEHLKSEKLGAGVKFFLHYPKCDEDGTFEGNQRTGTFFYEKGGEQIFQSIKSIWDGAEVNLINAKEIFNKEGERFLSASNNTLPVLEPHWLVSVTDILKAEGCVSRYFVDLRDMGPPSRPLVFGSMLHGILDDLSHSDFSFEESYFPRLENMRISLLSAGLSDDDLPRFESDARRHFSQIAGFARGRSISDNSRAGWTGEHVEVTRYSTTYGLEGRIDLVTEDAKVGLQIVELKSGSERDEHVSQLRCYRLLWDGVAERRDLPIIGYLLYSKSGILRSAPFDDPERERRILRARNELVAAHRAQFDERVDRPLPHFMGEPANCRAPACRWRKDRCAKQTTLCGLDPNMSPQTASQKEGPLKGISPDIISASWAHWKHFSKMLEMEFWEQGEQLGRVIQTSQLWNRIQASEAFADVSLASFDQGNVVFEGAFGKPFQVGTTLLAHSGDLERDHILRGRVVATERNRITMSTMGAPNAASLPNQGWILDKLPTRIGYRAAQRSLYRFLNRRDGTLFQLIYAPTSDRAKEYSKPEKDNLTEIQNRGFTLNEKQKEAVNLALQSKGAAIIQGPPGTGKTTVIAHIVAELIAEGKKVLLSAQTNTAVDKILESLLSIDITDFIRLGDMKKSSTLCRHFEEKGLNPELFFSRNIARNTKSLDALASRFKYAQIIASTTHSSGSDSLIQYLQNHVQEIPFDVVIIDEATQISEPMTLGTIALGNRFVLVGDHRQLPPIVQNEQATSAAVSRSVISFIDANATDDLPQLGLFETSIIEESATERLGLSGLDKSLFERLVDQGLHYVMLEEQYRMHEDVMAFSSRRFYDEKLIAHGSVADSILSMDKAEQDPKISSIIDPSRAVVFVNVEGEDEGRKNDAEASAIIETIKSLVQSLENEKTTIGVISPFRAQCHLIRTEISNDSILVNHDIDVDTVERFQGSERDIVIVSWVKSRSPGEFLADERRLNVTLTRARKKLILFGNYSCLILNPMYRDLIQQPQTTRVDWNTL